MRTILTIFVACCGAAAAVMSCTEDSGSPKTTLDASTGGLDASPSADASRSDAVATDAQQGDAAVADANDAATGDANGEGGCPNEAFIKSTFTRCDASATHVGQFGDAPGVTCHAVCCTFGFSGCAYRAAQSGLTACDPPNPGDSGTCTDIFQTTWSSQCVCTP